MGTWLGGLRGLPWGMVHTVWASCSPFGGVHSGMGIHMIHLFRSIIQAGESGTS